MPWKQASLMILEELNTRRMWAWWLLDRLVVYSVQFIGSKTVSPKQDKVYIQIPKKALSTNKTLPINKEEVNV